MSRIISNHTSGITINSYYVWTVRINTRYLQHDTRGHQPEESSLKNHPKNHAQNHPKNIRASHLFRLVGCPCCFPFQPIPVGDESNDSDGHNEHEAEYEDHTGVGSGPIPMPAVFASCNVLVDQVSLSGFDGADGGHERAFERASVYSRHVNICACGEMDGRAMPVKI